MEIKEYIREYTIRDVIKNRNPRVVAFGGGTGLSVLLRGLKKYTNRLTAVVTMGDDGGSSGMLREDLGILPPGDIRNCILALADEENLMQELFNYRFDQGGLEGHSFGNLFLAAMSGISSDFYDAVRRTSEVLQITGRVLPVTLDDMTLVATLADGSRVIGESRIPKVVRKKRSAISKITLATRADALQETVEAIKEADVIVLGPGSLYTSVIPHLLVSGICEAIAESRGRKFYVGNLMTQPGETDGYTQADHIKAIEAHCPPSVLSPAIIQYIVAGEGSLSQKTLNRYLKAGANPVALGEIPEIYTVLKGQYACTEHRIVRHDADAVARRILALTVGER